MQTDAQIVEQFKKHLAVTKDGLSRQYKNTEECQAFYAGDFMDFWIGGLTTDQYGVKKRAMVQINKVKPFVNAVKGFMAQNRRGTKFEARVNANKLQEAYSSYANGLHTFLRSKAYADQIETQQDGDMLINGYGAVETALTYTNGRSTTDPNGQVAMGRLDPLSVGWDPFAKDTNLLDARWVFYEQVYDMADALDLFQDSSAEDFDSPTDDSLDDGEDGYKFYPRGGRYNKIKETDVDWSEGAGKDKAKVYFYQWYRFEPFYRCDNPLFSVTSPLIATNIAMHLDTIAQDLTEDQKDLFAFDPRAEILTFDEEIKEELLELFGDKLDIDEYRRKVYYTAVLSKRHIFTKFRSISQKGFTIKFKTGDYDAKNKIFVGQVNSMREPVLYYNKSLTELMFIIGSNSKGGVLVEEDAVEDIQKFEQQWARTDAVIEVNSGTIANNKIKAKKEPYSVTGYENIVTTIGSDIQDVTGIDKSFLGSSENKNETGILQARRIRQVVSTLACYFDSITLYQIEHARLMLDLMYVYAENNSGGQFSIFAPNGKVQFMEISRNKLVAEYDVNIQESPSSPEDKREFAAILQSMAEKLAAIDPQTAKIILGISLKYTPIEYEDQQQILKALMPQDGMVPVQAVQQLQQQLEMMKSQLMQAEVQDKVASAAAKQAKAALDMSKVKEVSASITQKKADAFHKVHEAILDEYVAKKDPHPQLEA